MTYGEILNKLSFCSLPSGELEVLYRDTENNKYITLKYDAREVYNWDKVAMFNIINNVRKILKKGEEK